MHLEIERKYRVSDFCALRKGLKALGAKPISNVFEENIVYDTHDRRLRSENILLRIRNDGKARITLKLPSAMSSANFKILEELETEVADYKIIKKIFEHLGFIETLRYEKIRETWLITEDTEACLDHLVFGDYVEFEGNADVIESTANALGLAECDALIENYHQLNVAYRNSHCLEPNDSFVFPESERERLIASLAAQKKENNLET